MKVLIVNMSDIMGGAGRAAYRLHRSLLASGIDSQMLVQQKDSDDFTVNGPATKVNKIMGHLRPYIDTIPTRFYKDRAVALFSPAWFGSSNILKKIREIGPDIIHLHWICNGMIKIEALSKINIPIVWTLHDQWAFTGGCHYDEGCNGYKKKCGACPVLRSKKENDLSARGLSRKNKTFLGLKNVNVVGVSSWLANCAKESFVFRDNRITNLPNPIDTKIYKPINKHMARELYNLPFDKKLILFGAMGAVGDPRKGFKELSDALHVLNNKDVELVIFGSSEPPKPKNFGFKTHYMGHVYDDASLVALYSSVDVMIVPSLQEAFGQTASESMSCGTPVVAFATTGLLDIVEHKKTGYLAQPFDVVDLKNGIDWVLNSSNYEYLCKNARSKVVREFDGAVVANKYIKLYKDVLNNPLSETIAPQQINPTI